MSDLFAKFSEINLKLEVYQLNVIKIKVMFVLVPKLFLYKQNWGEYNALSLKIAKTRLTCFLSTANDLFLDLCQRIEGILNLIIPEWVLDPFSGK